MNKNISILFPNTSFTLEQLQKIRFAGQVSYIDKDKANDLDEMVRTAKGAEIIAYPADSLGKNATKWLSAILESTSTIKAVALDTTDTNCIDKNYFREHGISATVIPDCTTESVAEHLIGLLIASAKKILLNDRRTYRRKFQPERGVELQGKTLGIINVDKTAERLATLAKAFGMRVYLLNETPFRMDGMERSSLNEVLTQSDFIALLLPNIEANKKFLSRELIFRLKDGCSVVNLAGRALVDEYSMRDALETGLISSYIFEGDTLHKSPLEHVETAIMLKPFSKMTIDSLMRNREWLAKNILGLSTGRPHNKVSL